MSTPGLTKGLEIIEYISKVKQAGFNQMKKELDIGSSSLNRYLKTLIEKDYIIKNENQIYTLGKKIYNISNSIEVNNRLENIIYPALYTITKKVGFTSVCFKFQESKIKCICKNIYSEGLIMQEVGDERIDYIYQPWGYLYLSSLNEVEREYLISKSKEADRQVPTVEIQEKYFKAAYKYGYVDDYGELYDHVRRLAVPIYKEGVMIGAIGIGGIKYNMKDDDISGYIKIMKEEVLQIEELI